VRDRELSLFFINTATKEYKYQRNTGLVQDS
jgi:hypothetical protein